MSFIFSRINSVGRRYLPLVTTEDNETASDEAVIFDRRAIHSWLRYKLGPFFSVIVFLITLSLLMIFAIVSDSKDSPIRNFNHILLAANYSGSHSNNIQYNQFDDAIFDPHFNASSSNSTYMNSNYTAPYGYRGRYSDGGAEIGVLTIAFFTLLTTWGLVHTLRIMRGFNSPSMQREIALSQLLGGNDRGNIWSDEAFQRRLRMTLMRRDFNGNDFELLQQLDDEMMNGGRSSRGARQEFIDRLPSHTINTDNEAQRSEEDPRFCSICLGPFEDGERVRTLFCLHQFHQPCVDNWLRQNASCPICKASILSTES